MGQLGAGGLRGPKSLVISDLRPLFLNLYIHCIIHVDLSSHYLICILICLIYNSLIYYFSVYNSLISPLFISGSLFHIYLFTIYYFIFIYFAFLISPLLNCYLNIKKLPTLSSEESQRYEDYYYLRGEFTSAWKISECQCPYLKRRKSTSRLTRTRFDAGCTCATSQRNLP